MIGNRLGTMRGSQRAHTPRRLVLPERRIAGVNGFEFAASLFVSIALTAVCLVGAGGAEGPGNSDGGAAARAQSGGDTVPGRHAQPDPDEAARGALSGPGSRTAAARPRWTVKWSWPVALENNVDCSLSRLARHGDCLKDYVSCIDYMGGRLGSKTHRNSSNDIDIFSYRLMEKGVPLLAVADADVRGAEPSLPCDHGGPGGGYYKIFIRLDDGQQIWYAHNRHRSHFAKAGDRVRRGDPLCFMGASGMRKRGAPPHLHLEGPIDPFHGPNQPEPSLWIEQPPYIGTLPLRVFDMGLFTKDAPAVHFLNDRHGPAVLGSDETEITVWVSYQGLKPGAEFEIDIEKPDGTVYRHLRKTSARSDVNVERASFDVPWSVAAADHGTWRLVARADGQVKLSRDFALAATSQYAPRFWCPNNEEDASTMVRGRSFRTDEDHGVFELQVDRLGGDGVTYSLINAPTEIRLEGNRVTIPPSMPKRNTLFQAVATNRAGLSDTFFFHLVDFSKPYNNPFEAPKLAELYGFKRRCGQADDPPGRQPEKQFSK
jgi:murein DD-endopeptidase MepM/ murein hydrolase activator NlpD